MKKIITATFLSTIIACTEVQAQNQEKEISITGQRVEKADGQVEVSFRAEIGKRVARNGRTVVFAPMLTDGTYKWSLPAIVVQGRRAEIAGARHDWVSGTAALQAAYGDDVIVLDNGSSILYKATLDWQLWMHGADLIAETLTMGCCSYEQAGDAILYGSVFLPPPVVEQPVIEVEEEVAAPPKTTGEKLAESSPFIVPYSEFEKLAPGQLFDEDRENALIVYFRQGKYDIDDKYWGNNQFLTDLMSSIRSIENSNDSRVKAIVIAGFSSPDGSFQFNDRLAFDRAVAMKKYIMDHSAIPDEIIAIYNGSEDWRGLRMLVEQSDMHLKDRVLEIIDTMPIWDSRMNRGRLGELMRLDGGRPYRYMYENFFPRLRNAAYIKVYFENK